MKVNFFEAMLVGLVLIIIIVPAGKKMLENENINLNGITLDIIETIQEAFQRNVGEPVPPSPVN